MTAVAGAGGAAGNDHAGGCPGGKTPLPTEASQPLVVLLLLPLPLPSPLPLPLEGPPWADGMRRWWLRGTPFSIAPGVAGGDARRRWVDAARRKRMPHAEVNSQGWD